MPARRQSGGKGLRSHFPLQAIRRKPLAIGAPCRRLHRHRGFRAGETRCRSVQAGLRAQAGPRAPPGTRSF
jgi:hypothetical protein